MMTVGEVFNRLNVASNNLTEENVGLTIGMVHDLLRPFAPNAAKELIQKWAENPTVWNARTLLATAGFALVVGQ
jgi:hypothetical protein